MPTIVFTPAELAGIAEDAERLRAEHGEPLAHYITLYKTAPTAAAAAALAEKEFEGEQAYVEGRAAHCLLYLPYNQSKLVTSRVFAGLGQGTARNVTVVRALADKWG